MTDREADVLIDEEIPDALRRTRWSRSPRGNLTRRLRDGRQVTIFQRETTGRYGWCINERCGPRWSPKNYGTESEAMEALDDVLAGE